MLNHGASHEPNITALFTTLKKLVHRTFHSSCDILCHEPIRATAARVPGPLQLLASLSFARECHRKKTKVNTPNQTQYNAICISVQIHVWYIYTHIHICACTYIYVYIYICSYIYIHIHVYIYRFILILLSTDVHVYMNQAMQYLIPGTQNSGLPQTPGTREQRPMCHQDVGFVGCCRLEFAHGLLVLEGPIWAPRPRSIREHKMEVITTQESREFCRALKTEGLSFLEVPDCTREVPDPRHALHY